MKKWILFLLLIIPSICFAGSTQQYLMKIAKSRVAAGGACTIGNTDESGASSTNAGAGTELWFRHTASASCDIDKLCLYGKKYAGGADSFKLAIYENGGSQDKLQETAELTIGVGEDWVCGNITAVSLTASSDYWLMVMFDETEGNGAWYEYYDAGGVGWGYEKWGNVDTYANGFPATLPAGTSRSRSGVVKGDVQ